MTLPDVLESAADVEPSLLDDASLVPSPLDDDPSLDDDEPPADACPDTKLTTHAHPIPTIQRMTAVYQYRGERPTDALRCARVPKKQQPEMLDHDFAFASDRELDEQIAAFRSAHETSTGVRLAMHARRSLGAGKVRITFRLVEAPRGRR